jgi:hypothetical protein
MSFVFLSISNVRRSYAACWKFSFVEWSGVKCSARTFCSMCSGLDQHKQHLDREMPCKDQGWRPACWD